MSVPAVQFKSELERECIYNVMLLERRQSLHLSIGRQLEAELSTILQRVSSSGSLSGLGAGPRTISPLADRFYTMGLHFELGGDLLRAMTCYSASQALQVNEGSIPSGMSLLLKSVEMFMKLKHNVGFGGSRGIDGSQQSQGPKTTMAAEELKQLDSIAKIAEAIPLAMQPYQACIANSRSASSQSQSQTKKQELEKEPCAEPELASVDEGAGVAHGPRSMFDPLVFPVLHAQMYEIFEGDVLAVEVALRALITLEKRCWPLLRPPPPPPHRRRHLHRSRCGPRSLRRHFHRCRLMMMKARQDLDLELRASLSVTTCAARICKPCSCSS